MLGASVALAAPARAVPATPSDPAFPLQWNLQMIGAPSAWQVATGAGSTIAVVDTGVDLNHEDLENKIVGHANCIGAGALGHACTDGGNAGQDDNGHGTHVAGIAAAATDNQTGVAGTAPDASILAIKVLDSTGSGKPDDVAAGIKYATDHGATVINLSLGNIQQSLIGTSFQDALDYAFERGVLPVIAAGNNFVLPSGPISNAIVVGALNESGLKATYSNLQSSDWSIMAPGGEPDDTEETCSSAPMGVLSTYLRGYVCLSGTSMAAPHVSGAAAVVRQTGLTDPKQIVDRLRATARSLPTTSLDNAGALDLAAAVGQPPTPAPSDTASTNTIDNGGANGGSSSGSTGAPSGDLGNPTASDGAASITLPTQRAAPPSGKVTTRTPAPKDDGLSSGVVGVAVVMAAGVSAALGWLFIRGQSWARRTPRLDR
ncbi:MAG: thermitase [Acidimicrobiaceae bacterium]